MRRGAAGTAATSIALALAAVPAWSQDANPFAPVGVLSDLATYQSGCFAPCLCPVMNEAPVRGTFRLEPIGSDGTFATFAMRDVRWTVDLPGAKQDIEGAGTYKVGGGAAPLQQLELDLVIAGNPVQHFDSGLVPAGTAVPGAIRVAVSMHGMFCYDTVIVVDAAPAPPAAIVPALPPAGIPALPPWGPLALGLAILVLSRAPRAAGRA